MLVMKILEIYLFFIVFLSFSKPSAIYAQETKTIDSLKVILNATPSDQPEKKAALYLKLTQQYLNKSDYVNVSNCIQNSLSIAEKINNDTLIAHCYRYLGSVQMNQHNFSQAVKYNTMALEIFKRRHDKANQALIIKGLGDDYLLHHDSLTAEKYYEEAMPLFLQINDKRGEAYVYLNQATVATSNYSKRIKLTLAAKQIFDEYPVDNFLPTINIGNLGIVYAELVRNKLYKTLHNDSTIFSNENDNLAKAEFYLKLAIKMAIQKNDVDNSSFYTGALAELQEYKGDFKDAYYNIRKYYGTQDSIFSQENKNKIAGLESKREIDLKNKEIENKELQLNSQRKQKIFFISGLLLLVIIGGLLYRQNSTRKRTNTSLLNLNKELDEANKVKAKFFGILSHDLRSPVANLINFMRLQKREPGLMSEDQVRERERKISRSAESLLEMMESMLLWSKSQMQQFKPVKRLVRVEDFFSYLKEMFATNENILFSFHDEGNASIETDEDYLKAIMQNLTSNAAKALKNVELATIEWRAWSEGGKFFLSIKDNGQGIKPENLKSLFDDSEISSVRRGLGLHIIRDLAKAINCRSQDLI